MVEKLILIALGALALIVGVTRFSGSVKQVFDHSGRNVVQNLGGLPEASPAQESFSNMSSPKPSSNGDSQHSLLDRANNSWDHALDSFFEHVVDPVMEQVGNPVFEGVGRVSDPVFERVDRVVDPVFERADRVVGSVGKRMDPAVTSFGNGVDHFFEGMGHLFENMGHLNPHTHSRKQSKHP